MYVQDERILLIPFVIKTNVIWNMEIFFNIDRHSMSFADSI